MTRDNEPPATQLVRIAAPIGLSKLATSQYLVRWICENGSKAVFAGDWHEVLTAALLFMTLGATKIEIEVVREMIDTKQTPSP
jgi:hypothetical protein